MAKGTIKRVSNDDQYGHIFPETGGGDVYFKAGDVVGPATFDQLRRGAPVEYEPYEVAGRPRGRKVRVQASEAEAADRRQPGGYRFLNPYNFVRPLEPAAYEERRTVDGQLLTSCPPPPHDRWVGRTGRIRCTLEAVSPLFVSSSEGVEAKADRHRSYECFKIDGEPAIPASSLRGMVRSVFEAATSSCMAVLSDLTLSHRVPPKDAKDLVPARVEIDGERRRIRLLRGMPGDYGRRNVEPLPAAWIPQYLRGSRGGDPRRNVDLGGRVHGDRCHALVELEPRTKGGRVFHYWNVIALGEPEELRERKTGTREVIAGYLCVNGRNIENKHDERLFFAEDEATAECLELPGHVIRGYTALIEDYQRRHRDTVKKRASRKGAGGDRARTTELSRFVVDPSAAKLSHGDLVYACVTRDGSGADEVRYLVPVSVPRTSYTRSIPDLLAYDEQHACRSIEQLCPACRIFGWVHPSPETDDVVTAYASRLRFDDARLTSPYELLPPTPLAILSSPKPTTVGMYLKPKNGPIRRPWNDRTAAEGYDSQDNVLRGRKFYRHHPKMSGEHVRAGGLEDDQNRTIRDAVKPGARFSVTLDFENLASLELGALLWALEMDGDALHRLGLAKPLGFGSVRLSVDAVELLSFESRYSCLDSDGWESESDWRNQYVVPFEAAMCRLHGDPPDGMESLPNVKDLLALLRDVPEGIPIHYPRTSETPDRQGRNFEWFVANKRGLALGLPNQREELALRRRE